MMAKVTITCPKCLVQYTIREKHLGRSGYCKKCNTRFLLSRLSETMTIAEAARKSGFSSASREVAEEDVPEVWNVGDVILGVYEVKRLYEERQRKKHYAEGGMGLVYRVHHRGWDLDLAVKSPKRETFEAERGKQNFERECKTWIDLGLHPNIVSCYYVRRLGGLPRVFAEFAEEGSLEDWIQNRKLYQGGPEKSLQRVLDVAIRFAWGLHYAHEQGVIHQDVKPDNVMMIGGAPKVTDFGLAKARIAAGKAARETAPKSMMVSWGGMTPAFCSPEQIDAALEIESGAPEEERTKLTRRTDIWSWALSVLAMFCGRAPCRGGGHTADVVFRAYRKKPPENEILPVMPSSLADLLARCFQRDPEDRPPRIDQIAAELIEIYRQVVGSDYGHQEPVTTELKADALNNRAASLLDLGKQEEAGKLLEEAWECRPWQPQVAHNRGLLLWRAGQITDTDLIHHLEELEKTRPDDWAAAYSMGLVQLERGEVGRAMEALEQAVALGGGCEIQDTLEVARPLRSIGLRSVRSFTDRPDSETDVYGSSDNRWVLLPVSDNTLRLCNTATGRLGLSFDTPSEDCPSISTNSRGRWELSVEHEETLRLCNAEGGRRGRRFNAVYWGTQAPCETLDGRWRLSIDNEEFLLLLHKVATGEVVRTLRGHIGLVTAVFLSDDARWALSGGSDKTLRLWEVATGRCVRTIRGHAAAVTSVFLSADRRWALSRSADKTLRLWNLELLSSPEHRFVSPTLLCHVTSSEEAGRMQARFAELCASARAALETDRCGEAIELVRSARALPGYEVDRESLDLWSAAGSRSRRKGLLDAWCTQTFEGHTKDVRSVALSDDGRRALSGSWDKTLRLWDTDTGECLQILEGHTDSVRSVWMTPDGRRALSGSWDGTVRLWDLDTGHCVRSFLGHANNVSSVCLSADRERALSGSWDKTMRLWDVETGRCLQSFEGHAAYVNTVCLSADGRRALSGSEDRTLRLWDVATAECLWTLEGHTDWINAVCLSADGRQAISASKDWTLRLWDVATGRCEQILEGHTGLVTAVFLSADGRWALSGSKDKTVRLWELATGDCRRVLEGHTDMVNSVALTPDGHRALSGSDDWGLRLWELDWDYEFPGWTDWDEAARPYLETFLFLRCPFAEDGVHRTGKPEFNGDDLEQLFGELQRRGLGWLRPEGVQKELQKMVAQWQGPPPLAQLQTGS